MKIEIKLSGLQRFQEPQSMICGDSIITSGILGLRVAVEGSCSTDFPTLHGDHSIEEKVASH
jgi:hypothetical protein